MAQTKNWSILNQFRILMHYFRFSWVINMEYFLYVPSSYNVYITSTNAASLLINTVNRNTNFDRAVNFNSFKLQAIIMKLQEFSMYASNRDNWKDAPNDFAGRFIWWTDRFIQNKKALKIQQTMVCMHMTRSRRPGLLKLSSRWKTDKKARTIYQKKRYGALLKRTIKSHTQQV